MITVLGASGFVGSHLVRHLEDAGEPCSAPGRDEDLRGRDLGHVVYCIGMTGDFRSQPLEAVQAHVCALRDIVGSCRFDSLVYLSSTRVYGRHDAARASEEDDLRLRPACADDLYGLSKAMGEAVALAGSGRAHVVRLSNVYGPGAGPHTFLSQVLDGALTEGVLTLQTALDSAKDYVAVADVVDMLARIALGGTQRVYNVASGANTTHAELVGAIARLTGCDVRVRPGAPTVTYPEIAIDRVRDEFAFRPASVISELPDLIESSARAHALD